MLKKILILAFTFIFLCSACQKEPGQEAAPPEIVTFSTDHLVVSEVGAGIEGNNLYDYLELYNPTGEIIDLQGYSLWYQLKDEADLTRILIWEQETLVPPLGHYFIGYEGQDFGLLPDMVFNQSLVGGRGGLILKLGDSVIDQVSWGDGPEAAAEGQPAAAFDLGFALERLPGGKGGNGQDINENQSDFMVTDQPSPQNSGSAPAPDIDQGLVLDFQTPDVVIPGSEFSYTFTVQNNSESDLESIDVFIPVSEQLTYLDSSPEVKIEDGTASITFDTLAAGSDVSAEIRFQAPWTFDDIFFTNAYAASESVQFPAFAGPSVYTIGGGAIPISTARTLIGHEVVVRGNATIYPDGLYAGSGAKFYIQDETGGIQVYVPQAADAYHIPIGTAVQVEGRIEPYRSSIELIPGSIGQVEILEEEPEIISPNPVSVQQAATDLENLPGLLVQVEGLITRVEEFSYSYEVDVMDDLGNLATCYVDKLTGFSMDSINPGERYKITGIVEVLDDFQRIYPRLLSDFEQIYPPELMVEVDSPTSVEADDSFEIVFEVFNHTPEPLTNTTVWFTLPQGLEIVSIGSDGAFDGSQIEWVISELAGNGDSASVSVQVIANATLDYIAVEDYQTFADQWTTPVSGEPTYTFFGELVPIWAIQGPGIKTPYRLESLQTQGVVTGVFPDLQGFWIQELETDDDPHTSSGLFVDHGTLIFDIQPGDLVTVSGIVGEGFQQTQIEIKSANGVVVASHGNRLPSAVKIDPPPDISEALVYFESLEGMLVELPGTAVAVGPTNRYGEFAVVLEEHKIGRVFQGGQTGLVIRADDGSSEEHETQEKLPAVVSVGDRVNNLIGPLAFTYGDYKIEPIEPVEVISAGFQVEAREPLNEDQFSLMTWNVENLFDFTEPHPSSPSMPSVIEYKLALEKIASTILFAGVPTLVGLQEVENIEILEDIAALESLAAYQYVPLLIEGTDSRYIDVGYLLRGDIADLIDLEQFPAPEGITSRPPLLIEFSLQGGPSVYVLNNHFTSMSGGEAATEPRRNAQAAWNVEIAGDIFAENPEAYLAVMGDLNSYLSSLPIDTLRAAGLHDVLDQLPPEEQYTYVYQGVSQVLDHILVSDSLIELIEEIYVLHTNADYPPPPAGDTSPYHQSDHDPVITIFSLPQ